MNIPMIVTPDAAIKELQPLFSALFDYFPEARKVGIEHFTNRASPRQINNTLLACIIRYEVKARLTLSGIPVEDEEDGDFQNINIPMEQLANNGIEGSFSQYEFKILKSDDGMLPVPQSNRQVAFYSQQLHLMDLPVASFRPNVVILWRFDFYGEVHLTLAVPKKGGKYRFQVEDYYTVSIPHPVTAIQPELVKYIEVATEPEIKVKLPKPIEQDNKISKDSE